MLPGGSLILPRGNQSPETSRKDYRELISVCFFQEPKVEGGWEEFRAERHCGVGGIGLGDKVSLPLLCPRRPKSVCVCRAFLLPGSGWV